MCAVELADWTTALEDLQSLTAAGDGTYSQRYYAALVALAAGEHDQYRSLCRDWLEDVRKSARESETQLLIWAVSLSPNGGADYESAIKLARGNLEQNPRDHETLRGLGALLLRSGVYDDARMYLESAIDADRPATTSEAYVFYLLALVYHHMDDPSTALEWLELAQRQADRELHDAATPPAWNRKLTLELLQAEAIGKIRPQDDDA